VKKLYWFILVVVLVIGMDWFVRSPDSRSRQLTAAIEEQASPNLKSYPYKFWVMKVSGETAVVSTPRNAQVPALKALGAMFPGVDTKNPNDAQFIAAEKLLGEVQSEARAIVLKQPGIKEVRWELDRDWLTAHQIEL
jgi:hypothetical protein